MPDGRGKRYLAAEELIKKGFVGHALCPADSCAFVADWRSGVSMCDAGWVHHWF